jgi:hypothetical protein
MLDLRLFAQGLKPASFLPFYGVAESSALSKPFIRHVLVFLVLLLALVACLCPVEYCFD